MPTDVRDLLCDMGYEDAVVFDNPSYDDAIVGVTDDGRVVYDFDAMVESLATSEDMDYIDAADFVCYNPMRAKDYIENGPIIMYRIERDDLNGSNEQPS